MAALHKAGIPVARPLWYDAAPELSQGRPLFVRDLVDGERFRRLQGELTAVAGQDAVLVPLILSSGMTCLFGQLRGAMSRSVLSCGCFFPIYTHGIIL